MFRLFCVLFFLITFPVAAQTAKRTASFTLNGKVKIPQTIYIDDLKKYDVFNVGDVTITNHKGEIHGTAKNLSGVLLKEILKSIPLDTDNPKLFSEYYFICRGSDGYKVVYSWNELFNTATGNSVYIVTEKNHQPIQDMDETILMISPQDIRTGRRYLKNLETIYVGRADN
ncbi:MAG: molybdopterin-binding protein [Marivirga sp.]|nr:molybdopterin-binding protein [Marivirga sp.]